MMRLPRGFGETLNTGFVLLSVIDSEVLSLIDPAVASSQPEVWVEFREGPEMKMINAPGGLVAMLNSLVAKLSNDRIAPLEVDTVMCGTGPHGTPLPLLSDGRYQAPSFRLEVPDITNVSPNGFSSTTVHIQRVKARLAELRMRPSIAPGNTTASANVVHVSLKVRDVQATVIEEIADTTGYSTTTPEHVLEMQSLDVECDLMPLATSPDGAGCGEVVVNCMPTPMASVPGVSITGLNGMLAGLRLTHFTGWIQTELERQLILGARLHFEGFSVSGPMTIEPTLLGVSLPGAPSNNCSWIPPPPPPAPAPVRAISRFRSRQGEGELVSRSGDVKPFHLVPEVEVDWLDDSNGATSPQLPWREIYGLRTTAAELTRQPRPAAFSKLPMLRFAAKAELIESMPNPCWQKAFTFESVLRELRNAKENPLCERCAFADFKYGERQFTSGDVDALSSLGEFALLEVSAVGREDAITPYKEAFGENPCPGDQCVAWKRFTVVPSGPIDPNGPPRPDEIGFWVPFELPLPEEVLKFEDPRTCPIQDVASVRRFVEPALTIARFQVDALEFESLTEVVQYRDDPGQSYARGLIASTEQLNGAKRSAIADAEGAKSLLIEFDRNCPTHGRSGPHAKTPCWSGTFALPPPGTMRIDGVSGLGIPRTKLRASPVFAANGGAGQSSALGHGLLAVQGTFDRSGLRVITEVPAIYRAPGTHVTDATEDVREVEFTSQNTAWNAASMYDWAHDSMFGVPSTAPGVRHLESQHSRWLDHDVSWFADWSSDTFKLSWDGDVPPSFCVDQSEAFVSPRSITLTGGGLNSPFTTPAQTIITTPPNSATGFIEVRKVTGARGRFGGVVP